MKLAVIGSGISGLGIAYIAKQNNCDITVYEKNDYVGGHSRTVDVILDGRNIPVDTGFIVFNYRNYPYLTGLFEKLGVIVEKSDMSFGASIANGWLEYGTKNLADIFGQKANLLRLNFWRMIFDILKFNKCAINFIKEHESVTLGECLDSLGMGQWFRKYFILAIGGAIWSTSVQKMMDFPATTFIRFFDNHGLLTINDHPQWYTVTGGSREYVKLLSAGFRDNIHLNCGVEKLHRREGKVFITDSNGNEDVYDQVIMACHADQSLKIITDLSPEEKEILGHFKYQKNTVVLHSDESFMPKNKKCWASWVYINDSKDDNHSDIALSYWMNNLQNIKSSKPLIATLNPHRKPDNIYNQYVFEHPVFDKSAIEAQSKIDEIQGRNNLWFCGAYQRYGFHEDGLQSAVNVAKLMDLKLPWSPKFEAENDFRS